MAVDCPRDAGDVQHIGNHPRLRAGIGRDACHVAGERGHPVPSAQRFSKNAPADGSRGAEDADVHDVLLHFMA